MILQNGVITYPGPMKMQGLCPENKTLFRTFTRNIMLRRSRVIHLGRVRNKLQGLSRLKRCSNLLSTEQKT